MTLKTPLNTLNKVLIFTFLFTLLSCEGQVDTLPADESNHSNVKPEADAGVDQNIKTGSLVRLDASESKDPLQSGLSYTWVFDVIPVSSNATLLNPNTINPEFTADKSGEYILALTVSDGEGESRVDRVTITSSAQNSVPIANAGPDQNVSSGSQVRLDGSKSDDADKDSLTFSWVLNKPMGSKSALSSPDAVAATFEADIDGRYVVDLTVNDGVVSSQVDSVIIISSTANSVPEANAGPDQNVSTGARVTLDGSASRDANSDNLSFNWALTPPAGSSASLSNAGAIKPTFLADKEGSYVITLVVNDGELSSQSDTVVITSTIANSAPVADAGPDQSVLTGQEVLLDGSGSDDVDGGNLSYSWQMTTQPLNSGAILNFATTLSPRFTPDIDGDYVIDLIVSDGSLASVLDRVLIIATTSNSPPTANAGQDKNVATGVKVDLDGRNSDDPNNDALTYLWTLNIPSGSSAVLDFNNIDTPSFNPDIDGEYLVGLTVNDGSVSSQVDTVLITSTTLMGSDVDLFNGSGALVGYTVNNLIALPDIAQVNGRYRANLTDNSGNKTLHYQDDQGRLDAKLVTFPFEVIARNIGIGTQADSQTAPIPNSSNYIFAGIQVHVQTLTARNSSHIVVGHRGGTSFTIEGKNTLNSNSRVSDAGKGIVPDGRADLRVVGDVSGRLTIYWQLPRTANQSDTWQLYRGDGVLPGTAPAYASTVYVGLITYAQGTSNVPFVGTADSFEIYQ